MVEVLSLSGAWDNLGSIVVNAGGRNHVPFGGGYPQTRVYPNTGEDAPRQLQKFILRSKQAVFQGCKMQRLALVPA